MKTFPRCIPCLVRQAEEAAVISGMSTESQEKFWPEVLRMLMAEDWSKSPPAIARNLHQLIRQESGNSDPYRQIKQRMNSHALEIGASCRDYIQNADDPWTAAVRVAIFGNLLDSGAKSRVQPEDLINKLDILREAPLSGDPLELFREAEKAKRILYLADNAGEIVLDRILLNFLPIAKVTLCVRGSPILNDALREDANAADFADLVTVIDNGSDAPGTVLDECSKEFVEHFEQADLIISKGQGNFESLSEVSAPVFFLFFVKCQIVASSIQEPIGTMVARKSRRWARNGPGD